VTVQVGAETRLARLGPISGLLLCLLWAPMGAVVVQLPDLGSAGGIARFYGDHGDLLKLVTASVSVGFFFLLCFLGALIERLRRAEKSGPATWIAFGSGLMFMTSLNVTVGLVAAAGLLSKTTAPGVIYGLHAAGFVLAAPVALAGSAFFAAITAISLDSDFLPRWLVGVSLLAALANAGALGGLLSLTGPLNAGNGIVGGIAVPVAAWLVWIGLVSLSWMTETRLPLRTRGT
jgi:hypothetical protein